MAIGRLVGYAWVPTYTAYETSENNTLNKKKVVSLMFLDI